MTWDVSKPADNEKLKNGPSVIRQNFEALAAAWNIQHNIMSGTGASSGGHTFLTLDNQAAAPAPPAAGGTLYTIADASPATKHNLYWKDTEGNTSNISAGGGSSGPVWYPGSGNPQTLVVASSGVLNLAFQWGTISHAGHNTIAYADVGTTIINYYGAWVTGQLLDTSQSKAIYVYRYCALNVNPVHLAPHLEIVSSFSATSTVSWLIFCSV